jgi:hypothetical protein
MHTIALALALTGCGSWDSDDTGDTSDADTDADADSDTDSDADSDSDADPAGFEGDWQALPCLVGHRIEGSCSLWWSCQPPEAWLPEGECGAPQGLAGLAERLFVGPTSVRWEADIVWTTCSGDSAGPIVVSCDLGGWSHVEGDEYAVGGATWTVLPLGEGLSVISESDSMMLSAL